MKNATTEKKKMDRATLKAITASAQAIYDKASKKGKPEMKFPVRSLANVKYSTLTGYFEIGRQK